jgi:hypothetical protein
MPMGAWQLKGILYAGTWDEGRLPVGITQAAPKTPIQPGQLKSEIPTPE